MNTKGIKFLAVLAVLAMAFAAVAVITPVQGNDAAVLTEDVYADCIKAGNENVSEINSDTITKYYFSEDASVKVKKLAADVTIYVNNGVNVELKFGQNAADVGGMTLTIVTVSGDRAGKLVYNNDNEIAKTQITFTTEEKTTFEYTAAKIKADGSKDANATFSYNGVLALGAPAGAQLDIAPGEEIKIKEDAINETNDTFGYGIAYTAVEKVENVDTDFVYFTAPGATKSGYNLDETKAKMWIKSGSGSVYYVSTEGAETLGTVTATFTGVKATNPVVTDRLAGISVSNATEGTVTFTGKGYLTLTGTIAEKATVEIGKDILINNGTLTNKGKLILNNAGNEQFEITNEGTVIAKNNSLWIKDGTGNYTGIKGIQTGSTGLVDTSAISYILPTQPGEVGNLTVGVGQILTLTGNLTVANKLIVDGGTLNINSGVTVTIKEGAIFQVGDNNAAASNYSIYTQINNNGIISIKAKDIVSNPAGVLTVAEKSTFNNMGTIKAESKAPANTYIKDTAIVNASENFVNNGKITISKNDTFVLGDFDDDKAFINNGTIEFSGVVAGEIANDGTVTFMNGSKITGEVIIKMKSKDAKVDVKGVEIQTGESLTISSTTTKKDGSIVITADDGVDVATIKNVLVANTAGLDVSGSVSTNAKVTAKLSGLVNVTGTLTIPKDMTLSLASAADVEVSGTLTLAADSDVNVDALDYKVNVTGKIVDNTGKVDPTMGVVYTGTNNQVITDFVTALSEAQEAKINSVEVYGTNTVEGDIIIPAGMAVSGDGKLKLKSGSITVTVGETESASLGVDVIIVKGGLFSVDEGTITGVITADVAVQTESEDRTAVAYMDLKTALSTTVSTIALMDNADVTVSEDLTIPAGKTLDARNGKLLVEGCTLTVDGRLMVDSEYAAGGFGVKDSHVALGAMTVNGYYMMLNTEIGKDTFWYPAGVLYQTDVEEEEGTSKFFVITSIDNLSTAVLENTGDIVDITGNTKIGDVTIAGTESNPVTVRFNGPIDAGTIILSDATIDTNKQDIVKATFASLYGSITIRNASTSKLLITEDDGLSASGTIADIEYEEDTAKTAYYLGFDGIVEVGGFTADTPALVHDDESDATIDMDGVLTASGKTVTFNHDIIVTGSLIADNSTKINVNGDVQLLGNLIAMEKTEEGLSAGSIDITGDVYAGALKDTLFVKPSAATGDGASMSGRISIEGVSYVLASTTVDYEIVEDFNSLDISVDDEPYITVYTSETTVTFPQKDDVTCGLVLPIESAKISGIEDINGDSVVDKDKLYFDAKNNTITAVGFNITDVDWINVTINENVYTVTIKTDNGVKSVELGNMVMTQGTNEFTLTGLEAGTYTVTYSLKAGYEGTPVITTSMGTIIQGYTISVSGDYSEPIVYQLTGTQKEVEPEPVTPEEKSEWTITTILLCVLVVLIAIMAVIVALKLNRS